MIRVVLALFFAVFCAPASAQLFGASTDVNNAIRAYTDITQRFWEGPAIGGYPIAISKGTAVGAAAAPIPPGFGSLWGYGQEINVLYACWKLCPAAQSADARDRLVSTWTWAKGIWSPTTFNTCGASANNPIGVAQDDLAWSAQAMLQIEEALSAAGLNSAASAAATDAENALGCAWGRWHDAATGDGLYYDDSQAAKTSYQAAYVLALLTDYRLNANATSLSRAQELENWAATTTASCACLYQSSTGLWFEGVWSGNAPAWAIGTTYSAGQVVSFGGAYYQSRARFNAGNQPDISASWWASTTAPAATGSVQGSLPANIGMAGSSTFLAGNMAWAVVDVRLYNLTSTAAYLTRAQATAAAILYYETIPPNPATSAASQRLGGGPFGQMLLDDRDSFTNGAAAYDFANEVVPVLTNPQPWEQVYLATARSIALTARDAYGGYSGDWQGTTNIWAQGGQATSSRVETSSNAAIWPIVALKWATK